MLEMTEEEFKYFETLTPAQQKKLSDSVEKLNKKAGVPLEGEDTPVPVQQEQEAEWGLPDNVRKALGADGPLQVLRPITDLPANVADLGYMALQALEAGGEKLAEGADYLSEAATGGVVSAGTEAKKLLGGALEASQAFPATAGPAGLLDEGFDLVRAASSAKRLQAIDTLVAQKGANVTEKELADLGVTNAKEVVTGLKKGAKANKAVDKAVGSLGPGNVANPVVAEAVEAGAPAPVKTFRSKADTGKAGKDLKLNLTNFDEKANIGDVSAVAAAGGELAQKVSSNFLSAVAEGGLASAKAKRQLKNFEKVLPRQSETAGELGRGLNILKDTEETLSPGSLQALSDIAKDPAKSEKFEKLAKLYAGDEAAAQKILRDLKEPDAIDRVLSFRYNMLMSSPKTHVYNTLGTGGNLAFESGVIKPVAAAIGKARSLVTGSKDRVYADELLARNVGAYQGFLKAGELAKQGFLSGRTLDQVDASDLRKGQVGKAEIPIRALAAQDEFFRSIADNAERYGLATRLAKMDGLEGEELSKAVEETINQSRTVTTKKARAEALAQANEEGLKGREKSARIEELLKANRPLQVALEAKDYAKKIRFQDDPSIIGKQVEKLRQRPDTPILGGDFLPHMRGLGAALVFPFVRTPDSLIRTAARNSPLGVLSPTNLKDFKAGGAKRDIALARVGVGSAITYGIAQAVMSSDVTGEGPSDPQALKNLMASGWRPNSIKLPGTGYVSYKGLEPFSLLLNSVATAAERFNEEDSDSYVSKVAASTLGTAEAITNSSYLTGMQDLLAVFDERNPDTKANKFNNFVAGITSSLTTPAVVRDVNSTFVDPFMRETKGDGSFSDRVVNRSMAGWPGLSDNLPVKLDAFGRPVERPEIFGPDILSRATISPDEEDPVVQSIVKLAQEANEGKALITEVDKGDLKKFEATPEDVFNYQELSGRYILEYVRGIQDSGEWDKLSTEEKLDELEGIKRDMRKAAREELFPQFYGKEAEAEVVSPEPAEAQIEEAGVIEADTFAEGAVLSVFPDARITSTHRGDDHPLTKANPNSEHRGFEAVDVAPIEGMTFDEFLDSLVEAGFTIKSAKNEVGAGKSAWATGDHWHVVIDTSEFQEDGQN